MMPGESYLGTLRGPFLVIYVNAVSWKRGRGQDSDGNTIWFDVGQTAGCNYFNLL